ncbi:MAG: thiopurine S-methyltransferase [Planctomycetes bacterium]|nr:thiopurine S-methyltransferase [Planctomycetota bacterium]
MEQNFWTDRWAEGRTGWHASKPNPQLVDELHRLDCSAGDAILVPLSGATLDLRWLRDEAGLRPIGVEWAERAVEATFEELGEQPHRIPLAPEVELWHSKDLAVLCADWFAVAPAHLAAAVAATGAPAPCRAWWDRAALIALPPELRPRYAAQLLKLMPSGARGLLLALEYPEGEMQGPPFCVEPAEVRELFEGATDLLELAQIDALAQSPKRQEQGLTRLDERLYFLIRN